MQENFEQLHWQISKSTDLDDSHKIAAKEDRCLEQLFFSLCKK